MTEEQIKVAEETTNEIIETEKVSVLTKVKDTATRAWNSKPAKWIKRGALFAGGIIAGVTLVKVSGNNKDEEYDVYNDPDVEFIDLDKKETDSES